MTNWTIVENYTDYDECVFDPYWIYAFSVPLLGITFNGLLLFICVSFERNGGPRRRSIPSQPRQFPTCAILSSRSDGDQTVAFINSLPETDSVPRPELALNAFVANCGVSALLGSCFRTINTSYLFALNYVLCPDEPQLSATSQIMQILLYFQHSIFNVAYVNFLIVLNLDKLLFILKPLHYRSLMTKNRVLVVCVFTWLLSSAWLPLYFAQNEEDAVRWGTILVVCLMIGPSLFCLITSTILAVVVFRVQMQDRSLKRDSTSENSSLSDYWIYCKSVLRLFQSVLWTCVTSLPHPLAIIISYYTSAGDVSAHAVLKFFIGYLSIAYFSGTPLMIMWTYPLYWKQFKLYCA